MPKEIRFKKGFSPGQLYGEIITERLHEDSDEDDSQLVRARVPAFVRFCKDCYHSMPSLGTGAKYTENYRAAMQFLQWDLRAEEFNATVKFVFLLGLIAAFLFAVIGFMVPAIGGLLSPIAGDLSFIALGFVPLVIALIATNYIQQYPLNAAIAEQKRALGYVPDIIGYLIMSMKLTPNLEKALEFSAKNGRGKIADEFKKLLWDVQLGLYTTTAEALDELAYRWGTYSSEFKQAMMMVRASILEETEAKRYALLDKTMDNILLSIRDKMEQYARALSQPSIVLFYIGVLLPLILIIILPVGSAFSGSPLATPLVLILIYNIIIPIIAFVFALHVIKQRPPTYEPPIITDNFPGLPPKWKMKLGKTVMDLRLVLFLVLIAGGLFSFVFSTQGLPPKFLLPADESIPQFLAPDRELNAVLTREGLPLDNFEEEGTVYKQYLREGIGPEEAKKRAALDRAQFFNQSENDITPNNLVFGLLLTFSVMAFVYLHYRNVYKRAAQLDIVEMENEFQDSLYILASRLGENRPVEEALEHTRRFLPNLKISERIFGKTIDNIRMLSLPIEAAVFHPTYGSMVNIPSRIIQSGMRIMVDSVQLGVNVAAKTLISLSLQLENSSKVNKTMRDLIADIGGMMVSMSTFIAPAVLGITTALQKIVMVTLASIVSSNLTTEAPSLEATSGSPFGSSSLQVSGSLFKPEAFVTMVTPVQFLLIVAIYVIELVIIMTYFVSNIEEDNGLLFQMRLANTLPIAVLSFIIAVILANLVVGGFGGA